MLLCSLLLAVPFARAEAPPGAAELGLMAGTPVPPDKLVTIHNFIEPPYNRWSFQHLRELFPTRAVPAAPVPRPLPRRPVDLDALTVALGDGRTATIGDWLHSAYTDAFLVMHRGAIVYERYENGQGPATPHLMFSVTKSFTGAMMLTLMEQGLVDGARVVRDYLPELADTAFGDATVQQVMDMTNSIAYDETYDDPESDISRFITAMYPGGEGLHAHLQGLEDKLPALAHGEAFHYVTPDPEVLGWIIRRVTGMTLAEAMYTLIWSRLGTESEASYWVDPLGIEMAGGGLSLTLRDAARFGQMILDDGQAGGVQVLPPAVASRIRTHRNHSAFGRYYEDPWYGEVATAYHDQWWSYRGVDAVAALGIHGQFIYINAEQDVVIVKQSSDPEAENDRVDSETPRVMHAIAAHLGSLQAPQQ
ncbi:MAG: serine hydrolase domain-containing protein [Pseudohaliea sp.]